jgi:hypothetical protein
VALPIGDKLRSPQLTLHYTRAIWKVTAGELLTKQTMRKMLLDTKHKYVVELILNLVTTESETLVISENKFLNGCGKDVCRL